MKKYLAVALVLSVTFFLILTNCTNESKKGVSGISDSSFTFVFLTDIHLFPAKRAPEGFHKAIDTINKMNPDFVITGGDQIMDALGQSFERADSLYKLYNQYASEFNMPVYNTLGNHEVFGLYESSGVDPSHPLYSEKMYQERIGKKHYSIDHKGWHFMVLDAVEQTEQRSYIGYIDSAQIQWIKEDLKQIDKTTPIAVSVHIPFLTVYSEISQGSLTSNSRGTVINNGKEVLELFRNHNLKLVLQGHLHFLEDIYANGTHFITAGAVSGSWWNGPRGQVEEGFLKVDVNGNDFDWEYVDYGWEAAGKQ